jgi:NhaP-type Na+/H+ or K+/H+ antiporter
MTLIELSPVLSSRYQWLLQSEALERLLDGEVADDGELEVIYEYGLDRLGTGRESDDVEDRREEKTTRGGSGTHPLHRRRLADDDDDALDYVRTTPSPTLSPTSPPISMCNSKTCTVNEQCTRFLFGFLQGTTDAKDNCEGIMNAYVAADCGTIKKKEGSSSSSHGTTGDNSLSYNMDDDFNDDYFGIFYDHQCCSSLRSHYYEYCDETGILKGETLLVVAAVMLLCECGKSIVKKNRIRWLPEAASCMLVGMAVALGAGLFGTNIENIGFDEEIFMYLLLPPIIFEAALTVNKQEFRRRRGSIMVFAVFGTLLSSFLTGATVYYSAKYFGDEHLSILDSLVFGSLISSIDPVAILSVLTSLKMNETDTIYILVLGESLLNDGIAITLFKSLCQQYASASTVTIDDILGSVADFMIISFGSCAIGLVCGVACLCYFHLNFSIMNPVMEVASFFLWAVVPYWMSEAFGWSGIVAIVVMGFFMDIYLRPGWDPASLELEEQHRQLMIAASAAPAHLRGTPGQHTHHEGLKYYNWDDDEDDGRFRFRGTAVDLPPRQSLARMASEAHQHPPPPPETTMTEKEQTDKVKAKSMFTKEDDADTVAGVSMTTNPNIRAILMKREFVRLSREADEHVRFVAHILSSLSENAIFAYLGLFLFSSKYKWDAVLCSIGVTSCILSRAIMVIFASWLIWYMHVFRQRAGCHKTALNTCVEQSSSDTNLDGGSDESDENNIKKNAIDPLNTPISKSARALSNYKVQVVLILAGLRGAVSLALVESIPIYNGVTGVGSKNKPLIKAMTSSSIIFTIFVLGGGAYYILKWLDVSSEDMLIKSPYRDNASSMYYPPLVCGAPTCQSALGEVELPRTLSWRNQTSFSYIERSTSSRASSRAGTPFVPPLLARSRSDWSRTSIHSSGLNPNDIVNLPNNHSTHSEITDVISGSMSINENNAFPAIGRSKSKSQNDGEDWIARLDSLSQPHPGAPLFISHIV